MSHLTAPMPPQAGLHHPNPQKPYLFDLPRPSHPLTPPDTDYDTPSQVLPIQNMNGIETEPLSGLPPHLLSSVFDSPHASPFGPLHRKRPSVSYVNSGIRESRERVVQRGLKWLVVVLPPVSFTTHHGHLGHTLSSGPSRRLSGGLLMPLYPTLNSQLGAIAREFSFPSISGLCVYLHTTHAGVSLTPRLSDESWPLLWNHLFDARSPSLPPQQLPISGQIEFDIDLTKARWYESWVGSARREYADVPQSVAPSRPQSLSHRRVDSQTSINEPFDDQSDVVSLQQTIGRGVGRNIKKLSLLDRFDVMSVRSGSKLRDESPPDVSVRQNAVQALSPIVQEDEPATAKRQIDDRVQSWRMSATMPARSPLAATGQTSLDPANMPNTIEDLPTGSGSGFELNLDDYTWSVSSVGPPDYDMESVYSCDRVPSVHMDRRGEGSVCLTPSVCTSFGPDDDFYPFSPVSYMSRLPSPDIAGRMLEDAPPTPTTATSWGAPLSFPPSPIASSYAPSIDIAARFLASRPVTPTTATSWGAPLSYPPSPVTLSRVPSPDIGERVADSAPSSPRFRRAAQPSESVFPDYDAARASPWQYVWPYVKERQSCSFWPHVWPYVAERQRGSCWEHVWPYTEERQAVDRITASLYPPPAQTRQKAAAREAPGVTLGYPVLDIYPAVYPSFDIYPALVTLDDRKLGAPASSGAAYPIFDLYPAIYPSFDIYPAVDVVARPENKELSTCLPSAYPNVEPYSSAYPYLTVYPAMSKDVFTVNVVKDALPTAFVHVAFSYPEFDIYPAGYPYSLDNIYPAITFHANLVTSSSSVQVQVRLPAAYPSFDFYASVYPHNLNGIYPSITTEEVPLARMSFLGLPVGVELQYPIFDIYPAVTAPEATSRQVVPGLRYPIYNIYPAVYPWSVYEVYPEISRGVEDNAGRRGVVVTLESRYPWFNIYPSVYPYSLEVIYQEVSSPQPLSIETGVSVELSMVYPNVGPYRAVYPYLTIYPVTCSEEVISISVNLSGQDAAVSQYPYLVVYPSVYPFVEVYPGFWNHPIQIAASRLGFARKPEPRVAPAATTQPSARRRLRYTHMNLRAQVLAEGLAPAVTPRTVVRAPAPAPAAAVASAPRARPTQMELRDDEHMTLPNIVAVEASPTGSDASLASPVFFEIVTAPAPTPAPLVRSRSRSGTVNTRPPESAPSRPVVARAPAPSPPASESSPAPSPQRSLNRLSGLPAHPAVNRRISSAAPRPTSTFGPLPAVPQQPSAYAISPVARRQASIMSPLAEEGIPPTKGRSPQLPSPPEEWERGWRTPTEASPASPLAALSSADLSRSKTMPTRAAPRGPRSSTIITERVRAFDNPNVMINEDGPLKLTMSALAEFPTPPRPPLPSAPSPSRTVSKLDRSKYPFA